MTAHPSLRLGARLAAITAIVAVSLAGCGGDDSPEAMPLKVMEFNIEYGGTLISFDKVVEAIKLADPDVVGLEEAETNAPRLAKAVGFPYASSGMHIISKYPILEPSGSQGAYAFIEVRPGQVIALSNVHLPSDPYGPYWLRDGKSVDAVLKLERSLRLPALAAQQKVLPPLIDSGMPVFMTGDFNTPSYRDWTAEMVGTRKHLDTVVKWPVSVAVEGMGFRDSYREAHPDPVAVPGLTWWAARPKAPEWAGNPTEKDPQDRIDFIYAAGDSKTLASEVIGEKGAAGVTKTVTPWPSDHRAVVSSFDVTPAETPEMIATTGVLFTEGEPIAFTYRAPDDHSKLLITPQGDATTVEAEKSLDGRSGTLTSTPGRSSQERTTRFSPAVARPT